MNEEWRTIPGYEGLYEVSDQGRVRSLDRVVPGRDGRETRFRGKILSPAHLPLGYEYVTLSRDNRKKSLTVHRVVARVFLGEPTPEKPLALHRNGNNQDNRPDNLYWGDHSDNMNDALVHGVQSNQNKGKTHCKRKHEFTPGNTYWHRGSGGSADSAVRGQVERRRYGRLVWLLHVAGTP